MNSRMTRFLTATAAAISVLSMSGCALLQSATSGITLQVIEEGFTPPALAMTDVDMVCNFSLVNAPLVGAAREFHGDPSIAEAVLYSSASICAESQAVNEELRYLRAVREKRTDEAQDARVAQKRLLATATQRQYTAFLRMRNKMEQKFFFEYGKTCPSFRRDFDELAYLLGTIAGLQAMQNDIASQQSIGVPTDIAPKAEFALSCLNNEKWWGVPSAGRAVIWSIIPGGSEGKDVSGTFERAMKIGEAKGVRLPHVLKAMAGVSQDDNAAIRASIKRFASVENFKPNAQYRFIDVVSKAQLQTISDRMWTQNTGSRTPFNSLGSFWDEKPKNDVDVDKFLN